MNEIKPIEDQPDGTTAAEVNARMQLSAQGLGSALVSKLQAAGGAFNVLELELRCTLMGEALTMLTELVIELSDGKYNDQMVTERMITRVDVLTKSINDSTKAPKILIAGGAPPGMRVNGSKH